MIRPPVAASLAILGVGVFASGLALALAAGSGGQIDGRAVVLGLTPALIPCLIPTGVYALLGPQPASRFGYAVLGMAGARLLVSLSAMLAVWLTVEPQRGGFLLGFLGVAGATLVAEKIVALLALKPAWALRGAAPPAASPGPAGVNA